MRIYCLSEVQRKFISISFAFATPASRTSLVFRPTSNVTPSSRVIFIFSINHWIPGAPCNKYEPGKFTSKSRLIPKFPGNKDLFNARASLLPFIHSNFHVTWVNRTLSIFKIPDIQLVKRFSITRFQRLHRIPRYRIKYGIILNIRKRINSKHGARFFHRVLPFEENCVWKLVRYIYVNLVVSRLYRTIDSMLFYI